MKKGTTPTRLAMGFAISFVLLIIAISLWNNAGIAEILGALIPSFFVSEDEPPVIDSSFECSETVGVVQNKLVRFCADPECTSFLPETSKIQIDGDDIQVVFTINDVEVGTVVNDKLLYIFEPYRKWDRTETPEEIRAIENKVSHEQLLKLDQSFFTNSLKNTICRKEGIPLDDSRVENLISQASVWVYGKPYWFNRDELIRNIGVGKTTPLYQDMELTIQLNSYILPTKEIYHVPETVFKDTNPEGETGVFAIEESEQNVNVVYPQIRRTLEQKEGFETQVIDTYLLKESLTKEQGDLSPYIEQDRAILQLKVYVQYRNGGGRIYLRFIDGLDRDETYTPWILQDYWDAYRSFKDVPLWAKPTWESL